MNINLDLNTIIQGIIVACVVYGIKLQIGMSNSLIALKVWSEAHSKQDDERHTDLKEAIADL